MNRLIAKYASSFLAASAVVLVGIFKTGIGDAEAPKELLNK